jgi:hypothetical protein
MRTGVGLTGENHSIVEDDGAQTQASPVMAHLW